VGAKYYAVLGNKTGQVRLYSLNGGTIWSNTSTFGGGNEEQWVDITDKVYLNIDGLDK
ncbi:MAG: hypothetical protein GY820_18640, partial [Gammaproteobacteria bacterium]|nr:hypothetical protein [Gammaproteobacteria bacterium]